MLYLGEKLDAKNGDSSAPSRGGARRIVVIAGGNST